MSIDRMCWRPNQTEGWHVDTAHGRYVIRRPVLAECIQTWIVEFGGDTFPSYPIGRAGTEKGAKTLARKHAKGQRR